MDRQSFINNKYLNESSSSICGTDDCECEITLLKENQELKKTNSFHFPIIIMMAFVCAIILSIVKTEAAKTNLTEFILDKKEKVISCAPGYTNKKNNNDEPANGNNQNNCSHQQASLCETKSSNRKSLKTNSG